MGEIRAAVLALSILILVGVSLIIWKLHVEPAIGLGIGAVMFIAVGALTYAERPSVDGATRPGKG